MTEINSSFSISKINKYLKNYREIKFKKGKYVLTGCMIGYSNTNIVCEEGVVFERNSTGRMLQFYTEPSTTKYSGTHDVSWKGGKFIASTATKNANVIVMFHCKNMKLSDIIIDGCRGLHSLEINASQNIDISNCKFLNQSAKSGENFREAVQIDFANKDGLTLSGATESSACYDGTHCSNVTISNCQIDNCPNGIGTHTVGEKEIYHDTIKISSCKFSNISKTGIKLVGMKNVIISNCGDVSIIVNRLKTGHKLSGGKVELSQPRGNIGVNIDNITVV